MAVNYEDPRFAQVEADKQQATAELEQTYNGIIGDADQYYQAQIDASKQWAETQQQLQQEKTDFTIEQIEQEKDKSHKDYVKEQSGAYVDWKKQSSEYGVEAEQQAAAGLAGTGFSESSQVSMYNTYQNRVATARESYNQAVLNYNNAIKDARLQNNSVLAEIAYQALQQQLELSLQGFQYKNQLILDQANKKLEVDNMYWNRYQDVLNQINTENAFAEEQRQFDANYELQMKQYNESVRQFELEYEQRTKEFEESIRQFNEEIARLKKKDEQEYKMEIQRLELQKQQLAEEQRQYNMSYALQKEQLAEQKRQYEEQAAIQKAAASAKVSKSTGGSSSGTVTKGTKSTSGVKAKTYAVSTDYYQGDLNSDAKKYGTFSNGYQPKGISGHGTLTKTGDSIRVQTENLQGRKLTVVQNVWRAQDGTTWYWEGRQNKYIQVGNSTGSGGRTTGIGWKAELTK